ncbi:MAG: exo-beta-N-acetylmuramidase NamZ family protein [Myxococcota bacterium]
MSQIKIKEGIDLLFEKHHSLLSNRKIGVLAHGASVSSKLIHLIDGLLERNYKINCIFSPEHGLFGTAQDMEAVNSAGIFYKGIHVESLYGDNFESLEPKDGDFSNLDLLICDLQDIGTRYYTYVWTALLSAIKALENNTRVLILDRINPLGGKVVEGNLIEKGFHSFVGLRSVPVRHSLTIGEILSLFLKKQGFVDGFDLIRCKGWKREFFHEDTNLPWVMPSPNMPSLHAARLYSGMCLLEATNLSEGRGTTRPFEIFGAPYLDQEEFLKEMPVFSDIVLRKVKFKPMFQKHSGRICNGFQIHYQDKAFSRNWLLGLTLVATAAKLYPERFNWRKQPYEFVKEIPAVDLLTGSSTFREMVENDSFEPEYFLNLQGESRKWRDDLSGELLY